MESYIWNATAHYSDTSKGKHFSKMNGKALVNKSPANRRDDARHDSDQSDRPSCSIFFLFLAVALPRVRTFTFMAEKRSVGSGASFRGGISATRKVSRPTITGTIPFPQPREGCRPYTDAGQRHRENWSAMIECHRCSFHWFFIISSSIAWQCHERFTIDLSFNYSLRYFGKQSPTLNVGQRHRTPKCHFCHDWAPLLFNLIGFHGLLSNWLPIPWVTYS